MKYDIERYTSRLLLIIFFLCLNNLLMIYNVTGLFDFLRVPFQLIIISLFLIKIVNTIFNRYVKKDIYTRISFLVLIMMVYFGAQIVLQSINQSANGSSLINNISNGVFSLIVLLLFLGTKENDKKLNYEDLSIVVFLLISVMYLHFRINMPITGAPTHIYHAQYVNSIYYVLFLLPFVLRNKWRYIFFGIAGICVLLSGKQGAFVAFILGLVLFYITERKVTQRGLSIKLIIALLAVFFFSIIAYQYVVQHYNMDILLGFQSIRDDGGNGRLDIYVRLFSLLKQSSLGEILFGHGGLNAVANTLGISAHNDFFEILFDFGAFGLIVYLLFICQIIVVFLKSLRKNDSIAPSMIYSISIFVVLSMISHLIFVLKYCMLLMAFLGICISELREKENLCLIEE